MCHHILRLDIVFVKTPSLSLQEYNEDNECGGVFCNIPTNFVQYANDTLTAMIEAQYDVEFFEEIETRILDPVMQWKCRCGGSMLDAWLGCKHK